MRLNRSYSRKATRTATPAFADFHVRYVNFARQFYTVEARFVRQKLVQRGVSRKISVEQLLITSTFVDLLVFSLVACVKSLFTSYGSSSCFSS